MMKIDRIILYKTGIGFFARKGTLNLKMEKKIQISFKTKVMNDILKTLAILSDKGVVTGVSYEAADVDTERALEDALIKVPEENSFISLLQQLVGTEIIVTVGSKTYNGRVLGVQEIEEGSKEITKVEPYLVIVTDQAHVRNIRVKEIRALEIDDPKMNKELNFFLETIYLGKKKDTKTLTIFFEGNEEAEVFITYLQEMPSWKTSYRLLCYEEEKEYLLQGWALVDNILDEDWEDINLSLISGLPISFIYDLYTPNWIHRPTIKRADTFDIKPPSFEEGLGGMAKGEVMNGVSMMAMADMPVAETTSTGRRRADLDKLKESTGVSASGEAGGAGFEYRITVPVTVKRNQSSLVPILQSNIKVKRLCVYNSRNHPTNPMMCLELENTTEFTLEKGPISVFDPDFAGEAILPFMKEKETRLIAYGVELGITVSVDSSYETENIHQIIIGKYAQTFQFTIHKFKYTIKNKAEEAKTLIIEHPKEYQYELYETDKPKDETDSFYRYEMTLAPLKTDHFEIKLRRIQRSDLNLNQIAKKDIEKWYSLKLISAAERDFLLELYNLELQKQEFRNEIQKISETINEITEDQNRLRENLKSLGDSQSEARLKEKYVNKLENQEETLEKLRAEQESIEKKVKELEKLIQDKMVHRKF